MSLLQQLPKKKTAVAQGAFGEGLDGAAVRKGRGGAAAPAASAAATASTAFAEVVRAELNEKQRLIEKLMEEVNSRTEAIQVVGRDIRGLREEKIRLQVNQCFKVGCKIEIVRVCGGTLLAVF